MRRLSLRQRVAALDPADCDTILEAFHGIDQVYANALTLTIDGTLVCSAVALVPGQPTTVDPKYFLTKLAATGEFTIGTLAKGFITNRWVTTAAYPLRDDRQQIIGAVALPIDLENFFASTAYQTLGEVPGSVTCIINEDGTILARSIGARQFLGKKLNVQITSSGTMEGSDTEGNRQIWG